MMGHKEIEQYRIKLVELTKKLPEKVEDPLPEGLKKKLLDIAREIGACTRSVHIKDNGERGVYNASIEDLISNIHQALNTASMIDACRTAAHNFRITLVAMLIAVFAMLAAWTGVVVDWWCSR